MKGFAGELIGTLVLVFIGCSTVAIAVLYGLTLWQVALLWGLAVFLGISSSVKLCNAHLNPAVSLAMLVQQKINSREFLIFISAQFIGAFIAGLFVFLCFNNSIKQYETLHSIVRTSKDSIKTAMIFGEYFPNPSNNPQIKVSTFFAFAVEATAAFILVSVIFWLSPLSLASWKKFMIISFTVSLLIFLGAKYTQIGINPARDFGPRLVAYFCGWKNNAFPSIKYSFLTVYIFAPCLGSLASALLFRQLYTNET